MTGKYNDPELCAELKKLCDNISLSHKKIDKIITAQSSYEKQLKDMALAFPDGVGNHREYHEAAIKAKQAEEDFWVDLKKEIIKKGLFGVLIIVIGLIWLGIQGWIKINLGLGFK